MKKMLPSMLAVLIAGSALSAQARPTYICQINGKAGYSSEKINSTCRLSEMNGISEELADSQQVLSKPTAINGASTTVEGTKIAAAPATASAINEVAAPAAASAPVVTTNPPATAALAPAVTTSTSAAPANPPAAAASASAPAVNPNPSVVTQNNTPAAHTEAAPAAAEPSWQLFGKADSFVSYNPGENNGVVPTLAQTSNQTETAENAPADNATQAASSQTAPASRPAQQPAVTPATTHPSTNAAPAQAASQPQATSTSAAANTDENGSDTITQIWEKDQFGSYDDIKIMPRTEVDNKPASLDVKLRNQPRKSTTRATQNNGRVRAPVIAPPPAAAKPQLSRKQVLQREIANEQAALVRAQAQLARAQKAGGNTQALQQTVRDRQANVRAIQGELRRVR